VASFEGVPIKLAVLRWFLSCYNPYDFFFLTNFASARRSRYDSTYSVEDTGETAKLFLFPLQLY
jgi:hypothetical protein